MTFRAAPARATQPRDWRPAFAVLRVVRAFALAFSR